MAEKKKKRHPEKTKEKILHWAKHFFSKGGFHGARVDEIIAKAKVNKRMIYHYFGSKEGLYQEVHRQGWLKLKDWLIDFLSAQSNIEEIEKNSGKTILSLAIQLLHQFINENTVFRQLILWDALEGGKVTRSLWDEVRRPLYEEFEHIVEYARHQGAISPELKTNHLILSLMGVVTFYFSFANSIHEIVGKDPLSEEALNERVNQVTLLLQTVIK